MKKMLKLSPFFAVLLLTACNTTGNKETIGALSGAAIGALAGSKVGKGSGKTIATAAGAAIGLYIGKDIGRALDERDRLLAYQAQQGALERGVSGKKVAWKNPDTGHSGQVVPEKAYTQANTVCRPFTQTIYIDGKAHTARGAACRQSDGSWKIIS